LIVKFILFYSSKSEGAQAASNHSSQLIVASINSEISFYFCKDCRTFCEGEWEWDEKDDGDAIIKQQSANENYNWDSCRSVKADTKAISEMRSIPSKSKNALPFNGKSKTSFDCTSASIFRLVVAYFDWISQADSTTEIFATAITLAEVIMKQQLNLPPNRAIESSLASTNESTMFATSASLTKLVSSTHSTSLASSKLSILLYTASSVLALSATSATNGLVKHDSKINLNGPASKLIVICNWTKHPLSFEKIAQYFVMENGCHQQQRCMVILLTFSTSFFSRSAS
jgi:hypothetical protein